MQKQHKTLSILLFSIFSILGTAMAGETAVPIWGKFELMFTSSKKYENPLYDVTTFKFTFSSPGKLTRIVNGFWDGDNNWMVRFMPDEIGEWQYVSECSDTQNKELHGISGKFTCVKNDTPLALYSEGAISHKPETYHLSHRSGKPFFWTACTAWNGALKSTDEEWQMYLNHRVKNNYNTIQIVTTQWRGCDVNAEGLNAFTGTNKIVLNPAFFKRIDKRVEEANQKGLLVSPVLLWALPMGSGQDLSPGVILAEEDAILLARYIVARLQANHVVWMLGGDGEYVSGEFKERWLKIGRGTFNDIDHALATLHPMGLRFVGDVYEKEKWFGLMGYQSSHFMNHKYMTWITSGPVSQNWAKLKPMPYINLEPNYEDIKLETKITAEDVRNASWWSVFAAPPAGISYGANGIWPWIRKGELILNHEKAPPVPWSKSIYFPGSLQIGIMAAYMNTQKWWELFPAQELLQNQPAKAKADYKKYVSVLATKGHDRMLAYVPQKCQLKFNLILGKSSTAEWFDPVANKIAPASIKSSGNSFGVEHNFANDMVLNISNPTPVKSKK